MMIYVGNMSSTTSAAQLESLFKTFGDVSDVVIIMDEETNQSKKYGYVLMESEISAVEAVQYLNNRNFMNCYLEVCEVEEHIEDPFPGP